ncbi:rhomboid family intramembrane serine protease [Nonlabens sp. MB-3u-79]|uniref:rhomboid family intramembrane serine protease n=1 Tax=Nonlabens sp. MB-3u-79 TaxID=2058134 RepID=UPI000C308031|nr:rhomboid family intramembrane serine protease [Nonlabens sp. MB-3u-79]AUC79194.1 rhomboid family intramembrane serine protease [Nonlabens sp. MB-3u-79]
MKDSEYFKFDGFTVLPAVFFVFVMWLVYWLEVKFHFRFTDNGIRPHRLSGLQGVVFSPFIHSGLKHLWSNSLPCLILITALSFFYRRVSFYVLVGGIVLTGVLTWLLGRPSYHIGASGVVYMLTAFLFFKGVFTGHYKLLSLSFLVAFFYGSLIWYVLPIKEGVSWEGHLSGAIAGLFLAIVTRNKLPEKRKYVWELEHYKEEEDPFMLHFDENGNFVESIDEEE